MVTKRQICFSTDENILTELLEIRQNPGVPISTQIERILKRYTIKRQYDPNLSKQNLKPMSCLLYTSPSPRDRS